MSFFRQASSDKGAYCPTEATIRRECEHIRAGWTVGQTLSRMVVAPSDHNPIPVVPVDASAAAALNQKPSGV